MVSPHLQASGVMHLHQAQALLAAIKEEVEAVGGEAHGYVWGLLHGASLQEDCGCWPTVRVTACGQESKACAAAHSRGRHI